jgi:hypothetical protein
MFYFGLITAVNISLPAIFQIFSYIFKITSRSEETNNYLSVPVSIVSKGYATV